MIDQNEAVWAIQALRNGAVGIVTKNVTAAELVQVIERAAQGKLTSSMIIMETLLAYLLERKETTSPDNPVSMDSLTKRERRVLELMGQGLSNEEIAETLSVQVGTVKAHVSNILSKLQVKNRAQAALLAVGQFSQSQ